MAVTFNNVAGPVDIAVYDASNPSAAIGAVGRIAVVAPIDDLLSPTIYQLAFSAMTLEDRRSRCGMVFRPAPANG